MHAPSVRACIRGHIITHEHITFPWGVLTRNTQVWLEYLITVPCLPRLAHTPVPYFHRIVYPPWHYQLNSLKARRHFPVSSNCLVFIDTFIILIFNQHPIRQALEMSSASICLHIHVLEHWVIPKNKNACPTDRGPFYSKYRYPRYFRFLLCVFNGSISRYLSETKIWWGVSIR